MDRNSALSSLVTGLRHKRRMLQFLVASARLLAISAAIPLSAAAQVCSGLPGLLLNGDFEQPDFNTGGQPTFRIVSESTVPGWETDASDGQIEIWDSGFLGVPSFSGGQHAEANANLPAALFQDLATTPNTTVLWSFAHRGRNGVDTIQVLIGTAGGTMDLQGTFSTGTADWVVYSGSYTVPAGQTTTRFEFASTGGGSNGNFVDDVRITPDCDYGDAPASFPVTRANNAAAHRLEIGTFLGASIDVETDGVPSATADGDDTAGSDDEDGAAFGAGANGELLLGATNPVEITASVPGFINLWIDLNQDGDWQSNEQLLSDTPVSAGVQSLNVTVPSTAVAGPSFARVRFSTDNPGGALGPGGDWPNGEVEDYAVTLRGPELSLNKTASSVIIAENGLVTFTIRVTETIGASATGITITDMIPAGLTVESVANGGTQSADTITWTIPGPLNANATSTASVSVVLRANAVATTTQITNAASATSTQISTPVTGSAQITVLDVPPIVIDETAPGLCVNQGRQLGSTNLFTAAGNGTFGIGSGAVDEGASPNPFPGFISTNGYTYINSGIAPPFGGTGEHTIVNNVVTRALGNGHTGIIDPENGVTGRFLAVDGSTANGEVFSTVVTGLTTNTDYEYSAWVSNLIDADIALRLDPNFNFRVDGTVVANTGNIAETSETTWLRVGGVFNTGNRTSLTLSLEDSSLSGSGNNYLLDNIRLVTCGLAELEGVKIATVFDPLGEGLFALPGNDVIYTISVTNAGDGPTDPGSLFLIDQLPAEVIFFNGDADGAGPSTGNTIFSSTGTTVTFDPATDVSFSDSTTPPADFNACTYSPDAGFDPAVTFICFNPKGQLLAEPGSPSFSFSFRVRIR